MSGNKPVHRGNSPDERLYSFTDGACLFGEQLLITKRGKLQLLQPGEMRDARCEMRDARSEPATRCRDQGTVSERATCDRWNIAGPVASP